ncbi:MAG: 4Fe-4S dicluster domain-containing protein [Planctomycetota bacterium]
MCEFCHKHGEGKKWYLNAKNYSLDLASDIHRRKYVAEFLSHIESVRRADGRLARLDRAPSFVRRVVSWIGARRMKSRHYGQVVPIEDIERILGFTNSVVRLACMCRHASRGVDGRYCYGVSMAPDAGPIFDIAREIGADYLGGPELTGMERLTREEALEQMRSYEREGLSHSVWTFITPFIGGICNCDRADCLAMRATVTHAFPVMFRAEYVGVVDSELCTGCRSCMRACQFGAFGSSAARRKVEIDAAKCFGCGVCRAACRKGAIRLVDRASVDRARGRW